MHKDFVAPILNRRKKYQKLDQSKELELEISDYSITPSRTLPTGRQVGVTGFFQFESATPCSDWEIHC